MTSAQPLCIAARRHVSCSVRVAYSMMRGGDYVHTHAGFSSLRNQGWVTNWLREWREVTNYLSVTWVYLAKKITSLSP